MSNVDFSNIQSLTNQIEQLKQNGALAAGSNGAVTPDTFILQTQQNFNSMLNNLMGPANSDDQNNSSASDPFASLTNDQTLQLQIQQLTSGTSSTASGSQNLVTLDQTAQLLGKQAIYQDQTGAQATGVVAKILLDQQGNAVVEMTDGLQIAASAIIGIKQ
jgi:hypothetical protein